MHGSIIEDRPRATGSIDATPESSRVDLLPALASLPARLESGDEESPVVKQRVMPLVRDAVVGRLTLPVVARSSTIR